MLIIKLPSVEFYDEQTEEFIYSDELVVELEHSLVSLSKWESKYEKPFLGPEEKTHEETLGYVEAMVVSSNVSSKDLKRFTPSDLEAVNDYIGSLQSATTFSEASKQRAVNRGELITSELIYYWMTVFNIPFECEKWHLNRLFALLRICNVKNSKEKKMSRSEAAAQQRSLNAQRRAQMNSKG